MDEVQDYTIKNGLGIRVKGGKTCQVIRMIKGAWVEIGSVYNIPVDRNVLVWTPSGIPSSVLAVALRVYELDNPGTPLRRMLSGGVRRERPRRTFRRPERERVGELALAAGERR